uniref:Uncharacterized protein n=1 Tax=Myoviridae sp. ctTBm11 TaxID=2825108 RepID=A0A8S5PNZ6_9CAUD|nr:MAG TPA: hypothetical protein [Myoviridae sp. ctTBm11]
MIILKISHKINNNWLSTIEFLTQKCCKWKRTRKFL